MSTRPIPSPSSLWQTHVERVLTVLCLALERLSEKRRLPQGEEALDRRLFLLARDAYFRLPVPKRPHSFDLVAKAEQAPLNESDVDEGWVGKKPDFQWRMHNDLAARPEELTMDFDIENKRLGRPTSRKWVLTEQYVANGIVRFLSAEHRYGNGVSSGAMVGYIQDSEPVALLREVNGYIETEGRYAIPQLRFPPSRLGTEAVVNTCQKMRRAMVQPHDFELHHIWVDLRGA